MSETDLRRRERDARVFAGLLVFCVIPAAIGVALLGWGGLALAFAFPAVACAFALIMAFGLLVEWIFGGSPGQHMERQREADRG